MFQARCRATVNERCRNVTAATEDQHPTNHGCRPFAVGAHHRPQSVTLSPRPRRLYAISTRMLIFLSLLCGIAILVAFAVQVTLT
jgi:hypothetical protein